MDIDTAKLIIDKLEQVGDLAANTAWAWAVKMQFYYGLVSTSCLSFLSLAILSFWCWFAITAKAKKDWYGSGFIFGFGTMFLVFFFIILLVECIPRLMLPEYFALKDLLPK